MSLGTPVPYGGRSPMKQQASEAFAAFVGLDWADTNHDVCLQAAGTAHREFLSLEHRPEEMSAWVQTLRTRFNGQPVAVCLELNTGPIVSALRTYDFLVLFPVNPLTVAKYREAFTPSRAKDDPTDAELQVELLLKHRDKLTPLTPQSPIVSGSIFAWRRSLQMQRFEMGDQLRFTGPPAEGETEHLIRAFGRHALDPQADQQAGNEGDIHWHPHAVGRLTQQVSAAQHPFHPAEKQLHGPPIPIGQRDEVGIEVQPIRHQHHHLGRPLGVRLARGHTHDPEWLREGVPKVLICYP